MKRFAILAFLLAGSFLSLSSCDVEDEVSTNPAGLEAASAYADVGKGTLSFSLSEGALRSSLVTSEVTLTGALKPLTVKTVTRSTETSFSLYLEGKCDTSTSYGWVTLSSKAITNGAANMQGAVSISEALMYKSSSGFSSITIAGESYTEYHATIKLYNGANWISDNINDSYVLFKTADATAHPLTNLYVDTYKLSDGGLVVSFASIDNVLTSYSIYIYGETNDFSEGYQFTLAYLASLA